MSSSAGDPQKMLCQTSAHAVTKRGRETGTIQLSPIETKLLIFKKLKSKFYDKSETVITHAKYG